MNTCLKTIVLTALSAIVVFTGLTYSSCVSDKCKAITCAYDGVCDDGECTCATGYEGTQCERITRDKFLGTWTVIEKGTLTNPATYTATINPGEYIHEVAIKNFYNLFPAGVSVYAYVSDDTLYIPVQQRFNKTIEGRGYLRPSTENEENATMELHYYVVDSATQKLNDYGWDQGQPSQWDKQK
jgi:uncharacterized membrane protein